MKRMTSKLQVPVTFWSGFHCRLSYQPEFYPLFCQQKSLCDLVMTKLHIYQGQLFHPYYAEKNEILPE